MEIAVIGSEEFSLGFQMLGVKRIYSIGKNRADDKVRELLGDHSVGIILISKDYQDSLSMRTRDDKNRTTVPVVVAIGRERDESLRERVKQVMGVDLWS